MGQDAERIKVKNSRRPLWHWILLYVIVGFLVCGLTYYFAVIKKDGLSQTLQQASETIYVTKTNPEKGAYMTDLRGVTLYMFDEDVQGASNCNDSCSIKWPPYLVEEPIPSQLPENMTVITRTDGTKQYAWKGMPLYYSANDTQEGDLTGDRIGGVWHIIKP